LKIGHQEVKIQAASEPYSIRRVGLSECKIDNHHNHLQPNDKSFDDVNYHDEWSCRLSPCLNKGICKDVSSTRSFCECQQGFSGNKCQEVVQSAGNKQLSILPDQLKT